MTISAPPAPVQTPPPARTWSAGRVLAALIAATFLLLGSGMLLGGAALHFADSNLRDDQGYFMGPTDGYLSPGYAVRSDLVVLHEHSGAVDLPSWLLGTVEVTATPSTSNGVFIGIARTSVVDRYLRRVAHSTLDNAIMGRHDPMRPRFVDGISPTVAPADANFWVASASGPGEQTISWAPETGSWTLVVMNGEGTTPVAADVTVGAEIPVLDELGTALLLAGLVVVALSGVGMWRVMGAHQNPVSPTTRPTRTSDPDVRRTAGAPSS